MKESQQNSNPAGPYGAILGQAFPVSSALTPLWGTRIILFEANFLWCFANVKTPHQREDVNYLIARSPQPLASWILGRLIPCNTALFPYHQPNRIVHDLIVYPETPPPHPRPHHHRLTWQLQHFHLFGLTVCQAHKLVLTKPGGQRSHQAGMLGPHSHHER